MLTENKFSKYLIYAVGEIVLVVIGILIALQINTWNESRKDQAILEASLISMKLNLKEDIKSLNQQIIYNKALQKNIDFAFRIISLPQYENKRLSVYADSIGDIAQERTFLPTNTAFKSMESGSHFQWLDNREFKESIYKYYILVDGISDLTNANNQFVKNHMEGFIYNEMEFGAHFPGANPYSSQRSLKIDNTDILRKSPIFENALIGRLFRSSGEVRTSENAVLKASELIDTIDAYLDESNL